MSISMDVSKLEKRIDSFPDRLHAGLLMFAKTQATQLQGHMKRNRPWTDRTGMAKATLTATVVEENDAIKIKLAHGVDYGVWLELAHEKNYAIIEPTIRMKGPEVISNLDNLLAKIKL